MIETTYTLADGRDVPANSPLARHERELLEAHLADLQRISSTEGRRMYLTHCERSCGKAYRDKLAATYADDWAQRKARADAAKERAHGV